MPVFLRILEDGKPRDVAVISSGRTLVIGRSEQADIPFPGDVLMSSRHLSIQIQGQRCVIQDLGSTNGTELNGTRINSADVTPQDIFRCGATLLQIEWTGQRAGGPDSPERGAGKTAPAIVLPSGKTPANTIAPIPPELASDRGFSANTADEILGRFRLRQSILLTPELQETSPQFLTRLEKLPDLKSALEFLAFALPRRCGIAWLLQGIQRLTTPDPEEVAILQQAGEWLISPADSIRRGLFARCQEVDASRPVHWIGTACFFAAGSIAPENSPCVTPRERVCGQAVFAGVTLAILAGPRPAHPQRQQQFVNLGKIIAETGITGDPGANSPPVDRI